MGRDAIGSMSSLPDLSGQDDVYSEESFGLTTNTTIESAEIVAVFDSNPGTLARVFGLLATFSIVPASARTFVTDDQTITLSFELRNINTGQLESLRRKLVQLTDAISVRMN